MSKEYWEGVLKGITIGKELRDLERKRPKYKPNIMSKENFEWTDSLVKEFVAQFPLPPAADLSKFIDRNIDAFKQSHTPALERDWEIVEFRTDSGQYDNKEKFDDFYKGESDWYKSNMVQVYLSDKKWHIHSVKRLSDNQVFSIGDEIQQGKITYIGVGQHGLDVDTCKEEKWIKDVLIVKYDFDNNQNKGLFKLEFLL